MPVPPHTRLSFSGEFVTSNGPVEIWAWGLTFGPIGDFGQTLETLATKAKDLYEDELAVWMPANTHLTKTRVAQVAAGGRVLQTDAVGFLQGDDLTRVPGTGSAGLRMPLQTSLVISYSSVRPGSRGKGRSFLPFIAADIGADYRWQASFVQSAGLAVARIARGMAQDGGADSPGLGPHAVVSSFGTLSPVIKYRVGRAPDTMRSRRNALLEDYQDLGDGSGVATG